MKKIITVALPDIGEGVVEGEVIEWLKEEGDLLQQDEPVVSVMTDKATVELPSPYPGKLVKKYRKPGEIAIRGRPLYDIEGEGEEEKEAEAAPLPEVAAPAPPPLPFSGKAARKQKEGAALAAPPVRKIAREMGIDINRVPGSGKEGRVVIEDLKKFGRPETIGVLRLPDDSEQPMLGIRRLMAEKMAASKRTIPHFSYYEKVGASRLIQLRKSIKKEAEKERIQVTFMPLFVRALSLMLLQFPEMNSSIEMASSKLILHRQHNVGIAMTTENGLIVPVLKGVQEMTLTDIIRSFEKLKEKASAGKLQSRDMKEATISISNFGVFGHGGLWATPIINPPEVAILAINKIQKQPAVLNDRIVIQDMLNLSWSFDHRVIDGDRAARASHHFAGLLQNPAKLL